jgi:hypothetical protein
MVNAFTCIALFELRQVETGAKMIAFTVDDCRTGFGRQILKHVAQRFDEAVVQRVALGWAAQTHHRHCPMHVNGYAISGCALKDGIGRGGHSWLLKRAWRKGQ